MPQLIFAAADVKRIVEHSLAAPEQRTVTVDFDRETGDPVSKPAEAPSVVLVHDEGVYLMSNGTPGDPLDAPNAKLRDKGEKFWRSYVAYAKGCHPGRDVGWYDNARDLVGGDDFSETLPWAREIADAIKAGKRQIIIDMSEREMSLAFR
jgi:Protein of unknown function (DUF3085)